MDGALAGGGSGSSGCCHGRGDCLASHDRALRHRRVRQGLARGPDLEPPRPARAREDAPRAVAELGRDAHAQAVERARPRQDAAKLGEFARGPRNVENDLWVFSPLVLPLPHNALARRINRSSCAPRSGAARAPRHARLPAVDVPADVADYVGSSASRSPSTTASTSGRCSPTSTPTARSRPRMRC